MPDLSQPVCANCGLAHRPLVPDAKVVVISIVAYLSLKMPPINSPCCVRHHDAVLVVRVS
jgi:hypothetical protein